MHRLIATIICVVALNSPLTAAPHANRAAVLALLRREGILSGNTRVMNVSWSETGQFWVVRLRDAKGAMTNWSVDAAAKDYQYICQH